MVPVEEHQELGKHHGRGAPDFEATGSEGGNDDPSAVSFPLDGRQLLLVQEVLDRHFDHGGDFPMSGLEVRPPVDPGDDGVKSKAADGNVERREQAERLRVGSGERHFLLRLAESRLFEGLTGFDGAAWQRDLSAVPPQGLGAECQHDVRAGRDRKNQDEARRMTDASEVESVGPAATGRGRQQGVRCGSRQRATEPLGQPLDDLIKLHGKFPCGVLPPNTQALFPRGCPHPLRSRVLRGRNFGETSRSVKLENEASQQKKVQWGRRLRMPGLIRMTRQAGVRCS